MAEGAVYAFGAQRNEDYVPHLFALRSTDSQVIDITGYAFALRISGAAGLTAPPELALADAPTARGSYVQITDAPNGEFEVFISKDDIAALSGRSQDVVNKVFNLIATDSIGHSRVIARGPFIVEPGV